MPEYIEREALLETLKNCRDAHADVDDADGCELIEDVMREIIEQASADVVQVVHGKWGDNGIPGSILSGCSACGFTCGASSFFYCPNCGAKMDGAE